MSEKRRAALAAAGIAHPSSTLAVVSTVGKPALRTAAKRSRDTGPDAETVALVFERDGGYCTRCGLGLTSDGRGDCWSVHHRVLRAQGVDNTPPNLIVLCGGASVHGCHQIVHSRPAQYRREGGWILRSTDVPDRYPVVHSRLGFVFLTTDGGCAGQLTDGTAA
jgi:hypothetical protein